jgi:four helix bundle protein
MVMPRLIGQPQGMDAGAAGERSGGDAGVERFDFEGLDVFRLALDVAAGADEIASAVKRDRPWAADQLGRSSLSVVANTAEGNGEYSPGDKARFYRYARRSLAESAAIIILLARLRVISPDQEYRMRQTMLELTKVLTRMVLHCEREARIRRRQWKPRRY